MLKQCNPSQTLCLLAMFFSPNYVGLSRMCACKEYIIVSDQYISNNLLHIIEELFWQIVADKFLTKCACQ